MPITPDQFEATLRKVILDQAGRLAAKTEVDDLTDIVAALVSKIGSFLDTEWAVHCNVEHQKLEDRLRAVEQGIARHKAPT